MRLSANTPGPQAGQPDTPIDAKTDYLDSQWLLDGRNEILIRHGDQVYRLRKTRHGKLILNK